tara:strand:+ start:560 stop:730 length:171 start_codon:yes stop_codon:yes gene_type:complete
MFWFIEGKQLNYFEHESKKTQGQRIFLKLFHLPRNAIFGKKQQHHDKITSPYLVVF